ncbi:hypothetical protein ABIB40_003319 [Pedobacter sp. UYP30]|uniref:hypothetical protein n=1 Tax=Pedobacter sp. UYP30 TaxID=1756400 RepID=UPI003390AC5C
MGNKSVTYKSTTYHNGKAFLYGFPIFAFGTLFLLFAAVKIGAFLIFVIGWIALIIIPFFFQKKFKLLFTRNITLDFDNDAVKMIESSTHDDLIKDEITIFWDDIDNYKCYFSVTNVTYLILSFRDGSSKQFSFNDKEQKFAIKEESVFSLFYASIAKYNLSRADGDKIVFKPGFFTTKGGLVLLYSMLMLAIVLIVLHFIYQPKTATVSVIALVIILGLFGKRKKDTLFKEQIENLKPIALQGN